MANLFPLVAYDQTDLAEANRLLIKWGHKMGPVNRPMNGSVLSAGNEAHILTFQEQPIGVTVTSSLISANVAQRADLHRENTIELSRICAVRSSINRVLLRLWREFVFSLLPHRYAISYQDVAIHTGDLYRFDGWTPIVALAHSGRDRRSDRPGRDKRIWCYQKIQSERNPTCPT